MRTEQLIADLAGRAGKAPPLRPPSTRLLVWSAAAMASAATAVLVFGARRHLGLLVGEPWFIASAVLVASTAGIAAAASLVLAVPGAERSRVLRMTAFSLLAVWGTIAVSAVFRAGHGLSDASDWYVCFARVLSIALAPAWALLVMLRRGFPLQPDAASALGALGSAAVGGVTIQFVCPLDVPAHTLLGHFSPALTACVAAAIAAPWLLRRRVRS